MGLIYNSLKRNYIDSFKPRVFGMEKVWHRALFGVGEGVCPLLNPFLYHFPKIFKSE